MIDEHDRGDLTYKVHASWLKQGRLHAKMSNELTHHQLKILILVADGLADKQIALLLGVSVFTVNKHVRTIYEKLGVKSRAHAAVKAIRAGVID